MEDLSSDEMYLHVLEELQKEPYSKRCTCYRIEKDGIMMYKNRMDISWDVCEEFHERAHVTESNKHDRGTHHGCIGEILLGHERLRREVHDELHQVSYSTHPSYQKMVISMRKFSFWT